jgi:hypothetical protein
VAVLEGLEEEVVLPKVLEVVEDLQQLDHLEVVLLEVQEEVVGS